MATEATILGKLGIDTEEYNQKLKKLEENYARERDALIAQREKALAEAYKNFRVSGSNLSALASAEGRKGGLAESDSARILATYLEARQDAEELFGGKLSDAQYKKQEESETYRQKLKKLKDQAELEIAAIKAKEAEAAAKAAAKARKTANTQKTGDSGRNETPEKKETVYTPKILNKTGRVDTKK